MRWLAFVVLGACQFDPTPATTTDGSVTDGPTLTDTPSDTDGRGSVRSIDITDAQVTGGPHSEFPLLISLTETYLRDGGHGGDVARADGFDIYFSVDQGGATRLAHEVETYDPTTGALIAWVKIPSLTAATTVFLHYGDPANTTDPQMATAVWSNGYALVGHLDDASDSTAKANQISSSTSGAATGQIGQATSFDGSTDLIDFGSTSAIDDIFQNGATAEAWIDPASFGESSFGRVFEKSTWRLMVDDNNATRSLTFHQDGSSQGAWGSPSNSISTNAWHHIVLTYDSSSSANDPSIFIDGSSVSVDERVTPSNPASDAASPLVIGNTGDTTRAFSGLIDEIRLSTVIRDADWIATEFANQSNPGAFYTVSAPL